MNTAATWPDQVPSSRRRLLARRSQGPFRFREGGGEGERRRAMKTPVIIPLTFEEYEAAMREADQRVREGCTCRGDALDSC